MGDTTAIIFPWSMFATRAVTRSLATSFQAYRSFSQEAPTCQGSLDRHRRRLLYQSKQRGMKETCILIGGFAEKYLPTMTSSQIEQYERILAEIDPALNEWITGVRPFPDDLRGEVSEMMEHYANNNPLGYQFVASSQTHDV